MGVDVKRLKSVSIKNISKNKVFEIKDLFIYGFLLLFILILFLCTFFSCKTSNNGFTVTINGTNIITHEYGKNFEVSKEWTNKVTISQTQDGYLIKILSQDGGFNTLLCNDKNNSVKMLDSDCPSGNCKYMGELTNAGAIYCAPRDLKIVPLINNGDLPPVIGGAG